MNNEERTAAEKVLLRYSDSIIIKDWGLALAITHNIIKEIQKEFEKTIQPEIEYKFGNSGYINIGIIKHTKEKALFEKFDRNIPWFDHDCSNENILKILRRENDAIDRVKFEDGEFISSLLNVYFK